MKPKSRLSVRLASIGTSFVLAGAALLMATPAALANGSANIDGARATFTSDGEVFRLYDTKCDAHPVYLQYTYQGSTRTMHFSGGCGKSATFDLDFPENQFITYRACVNIQNLPDRCSGWTSDVT